MITVTVNELLSGAIKRFLACGLSLPAWKSLRHTGEACDKEVKLVQEKQKALVDKHGGQLLENGTIKFESVETAKVFAEEWEVLMNMTIELPGDPIKIEDLQSGSLAAGDNTLLKAFFVD